MNYFTFAYNKKRRSAPNCELMRQTSLRTSSSVKKAAYANQAPFSKSNSSREHGRHSKGGVPAAAARRTRQRAEALSGHDADTRALLTNLSDARRQMAESRLPTVTKMSV